MQPFVVVGRPQYYHSPLLVLWPVHEPDQGVLIRIERELSHTDEDATVVALVALPDAGDTVGTPVGKADFLPYARSAIPSAANNPVVQGME